MRLIERIRAARPDLLLSGDFIVGFPEETDADFQDTMALIREVGYGQAYSFKYSSRPGTPAAERTLVDADVASARLQDLQALIVTQQRQVRTPWSGARSAFCSKKTAALPGR